MLVDPPVPKCQLCYSCEELRKDTAFGWLYQVGEDETWSRVPKKELERGFFPCDPGKGGGECQDVFNVNLWGAGARHLYFVRILKGLCFVRVLLCPLSPGDESRVPQSVQGYRSKDGFEFENINNELRGPFSLRPPKGISLGPEKKTEWKNLIRGGGDPNIGVWSMVKLPGSILKKGSGARGSTTV